MPDVTDFLPTALQEFLLKAILFEGEAAIHSWKAWQRRISVEDLDHSSQQLLPLVLDKLWRTNVDHVDLRKYQSVTRYIWLKNQLILRATQQILCLFADTGIPAMPLGSLPIALLYHEKFWLRALDDLNILVRPDFAARASRVLNGEGWHAADEAMLESIGFLRTRHALTFVKAQDFEINLHWYVTADCCKPGADDAIWRLAQCLTNKGLATVALSDTDHLFYACLQERLNEPASLSVIVDCAQIIRSTSIDWERLIEQSRQFDRVIRVRRTLGYLRKIFCLPIPDTVIARLMAIRPSRIEEWEERASISRMHLLLKPAVWRYANYRRNGDRHGGFLRYLQDTYRTRTLTGTLFSVVYRAARTISASANKSNRQSSKRS
jgi:Uncharacterised nucleotidyltransferase